MSGFFLSVIMFGVTLILGVPIGICMGLTGIVGIITLTGVPLQVVAQRMFTGLDSFPLMCIPFFVLAGEIMNKSEITDRIINFVNVLFGRFRGTLAYANVGASTLFGGITGAASADVSALGSIFIPSMVKDGYDAPFSAAVTAASSLQGPIIPPSILAVIYGATMGTSIGALFAAGIPIGILVGIADCIIVSFLSKKRNYPQKLIKVNFKEFVRLFMKALIALGMPLIIIVGILGGVFTPTEAAAVSVGYALFIGFFVIKTLKVKDLPELFINSAITTGVIFLLLSTANVYAWVISVYQIPVNIRDFILSISSNRIIIILLINIFLLGVGCVMDTGASIIMFAPVLAPLATKIGMHPIQFGMMMIINLCLGLLTPPVGLCLFLSANIAQISVESVARAAIPFLLISMVVLLLVSYWPGLVLFIPKLLGYL